MQLTKKQLIKLILPFTILFVTVYSVLSLPNEKLPLLSYLKSTTVWWVISVAILVVFIFSNTYFFDKKNKSNLRFVLFYLFWNVICIVRGMFVAEGYWEWKGLIGNIFALLLPIVVYSATNKAVVQSLLSFYIKFGLPLFLIFALLIRTDAYGFYLVPVSFLLLFLPALSLRQKLILIFFTAVVLTADLGARSNIIKFVVPFVFLLFYYFRNTISVKTMEIIRLILIATPILLFVLGISGVFNVFKMDEYIKTDYEGTGVDESGNRVKTDLKGDTRTFIYIEVLQSAKKNNYWLFGRTPARGNESESFGEIEYELTRRYERLTNEVAITNVFTWTGIIGVILYFLIFFSASFLAVNRSENIYAKIIGLYIAFRWLYAWVEDVNNFSLNYLMLWIMLGLCYSFTFRGMTNREVTIWVRGIFDKRYLTFEDGSNNKEKNE